MEKVTIADVVKDLAALVFMVACFYLFFLGAAGEFEPRQEPRQSRWEISTGDGRDHTTGHGYYLRRAERGR